jgi:hypothetical protein
LPLHPQKSDLQVEEDRVLAAHLAQGLLVLRPEAAGMRPSAGERLPGQLLADPGKAAVGQKESTTRCLESHRVLSALSFRPSSFRVLIHCCCAGTSGILKAAVPGVVP